MGQVTGLEQERLRSDVVHVELRQQLVGADHFFQGRRADAPPAQGVHQKRGRAGFEPVGLELAAVEEQQDVERVVDRFVTTPVVAVVPGTDLVAVETRQLGREHGVKVRVGVAADGRVARVERDVLQVVEVRRTG